MKIMIFLQGTILMHESAIGKAREDIVAQSIALEESIRDFRSYVPIGHAVEKLNSWSKQGAEICYLSALTENQSARGDEIVSQEDIQFDQEILSKFGLPFGKIYHRQTDENYAQITERIVPDILIEDDCESIGGEKEMTITFIDPELKRKIKSIVIKEFGGIDHLPDDLDELSKYENATS